jgi:hypothetical protein
MTTYYIANGGANGNSGLTTLLPWADFTNVTSGNIDPGDSILLKRGSTWRSQWGPDFDGSAGLPITLGAYDTGANPVISGANLATGWTNYSGNIWQASGSNSEGNSPREIFINGVVGDIQTSIGACVNEYDWFWSGGTLYLYATSDPDTLYTSPGVEFRNRQYCVTFDVAYWIFDGITAEKSWMGAWKSSTSSYSEIKNCVGQYAGDGFWMGNGGAHDNSVHDCVFYYNDERGMGFELNFVNNKFYRNEVYENGTNGLGDQYNSGIKFWDNTDITWTQSGNEFYENYIHDNNVGIWSDGVQNPDNPTLIHHNWIEDNVTEGIVLEVTSGTQVWGNVIVNCGTSPTGENEAWTAAGISLNTRLNYPGSNNLIYNNTIYGANVGINVWNDNYNITTMRSDNNLIKNNIVVNSITRPFSAGLGGNNVTYGSGNVYQYNCFGPESTNFIRWGSNYYSTYAAWEGATGVILDGGTTHSINADPLLTNPTTHDFTLQAASPCINAGVSLGTTYKYGLMHDSVWPAAVVLGDQGAHGAGWEIGAYIYEASGSWIVGALAVGGS